MSYSGNPANSDSDAVRFLIQDTDTSNEDFSDSEIAYVLTQTSSDVYDAAIALCRIAAAKYAKIVDSAIDSVRINASKKYSNFVNLASQIEKVKNTLSSSGQPSPVVTGISITEILDVQDDTDIIPKKFKQGMFENPPGLISEDSEEYYSR